MAVSLPAAGLSTAVAQPNQEPGPKFIPSDDEPSLPVGTEPAFQNLGELFRLPIVVTHAGDGSKRIFIAEQYGVVKVLTHPRIATEARVFLDIESRCSYKNEQNEEGFLGLAFHPRHKENGQFFVFYNTVDEPHTCVLSRFRLSKFGRDEADPASEEVLLKITMKYWNHNGGTIAFGPDGYLYIGLGDGGSREDPDGHGQNPRTLLGSILRIDVDHPDKGKKYGIPKTNPFADGKEGQPEIYAIGFRNIWRMSFDRKTGALFAADVGQDTWEEINVVVRGGNYGWALREGKHRHGKMGVDASPKFVEPIWEYHHDYGRSITGGGVYRGKAVPKLEGMYVYADYVSGRIWALDYDQKSGKVRQNYVIRGPGVPVTSFGEDEEGEMYFTLPSGHVFRFTDSLLPQ
jgi:quinoprotein glucose dehydrogenase